MTTPEELAQEAKRFVVCYVLDAAPSLVKKAIEGRLCEGAMDANGNVQVGFPVTQSWQDLIAAIDALAKRAEAAEALAEQYRKDAERYRWLRLPTSTVPISNEAARNAEVYDAAIDAAMAKEGKSHE